MNASDDSGASKVIVGYDGRERSDDALVLGNVLARALAAELVAAVAVNYEPAQVVPADYNRARAAFFDEAFERATAVLGGADFKRVELQDTPAHGLHQLAQRPDVATVVVGSSHRGPAGRIFPGSVAERLLHGSPCPVAVAPAGYAEKDGGIESVTVGVDGRPESKLATDFAVELARHAHARLTLLRVGPDVYWGSYGIPPIDEIDRENRRSLKAALKQIPSDVQADSHYCLGDPAEELIRHSASHDLLVIGSRGYGPIRSALLGGVASFVVRHATTPVVVVPRGVAADDSRDDAVTTVAAIA